MNETISSLIEEKVNNTGENTEKNKDYEKSIKQLYEIFFDAKQEKVETKKEDNEENEKLKIYSNQLKAIFGGMQADYKELIQQNMNLNLREIVSKYCQTHEVPEEEGYSKLLNHFCNRMATRFNKPSEEFKEFVEEHINLEYQNIQKMYNQQLKEKLQKEKLEAKAEKKAQKEAESE